MCFFWLVEFIADEFETFVTFMLIYFPLVLSQEPIPDGKIRMNSPVCKILWDQGENARVLVVTQDGSSYLADHVLVTSSVGHLKERQASLFQPALPQKYREALAVRPRSSHSLYSMRMLIPNNKCTRAVFMPDI